MATITCLDCGNSVSPTAPSCPHCGRPHPGLTKEQIEAEESKKGCSEALGCLTIMWFGNAFLALVFKGFVKGVMALMVGPLVWMVTW